MGRGSTFYPATSSTMGDQSHGCLRALATASMSILSLCNLQSREAISTWFLGALAAARLQFFCMHINMPTLTSKVDGQNPLDAWDIKSAASLTYHYFMVSFTFGMHTYLLTF